MKQQADILTDIQACIHTMNEASFKKNVDYIGADNVADKGTDEKKYQEARKKILKKRCRDFFKEVNEIFFFFF